MRHRYTGEGRKKGKKMDRLLMQKIYERYYRKLFCYALSLCHNKADAEDLVSDTFVKALLSWSGNGSLEAWLYRVLKNRFIDETRRREHIVDADPQFIENIADLQSSDAEERIQKEWLYKKIMELKSPDREILFLTLTSGLQDTDIAQITGVSVNHLRVIRHRAKENLKAQARKEGF